MRRAGAVLTRTMIAEHVWDFSFEHASNVVDVYVKHLRDKIDETDGTELHSGRARSRLCLSPSGRGWRLRASGHS